MTVDVDTVIASTERVAVSLMPPEGEHEANSSTQSASMIPIADPIFLLNIVPIILFAVIEHFCPIL